jgi:ribose/xylose/arabinose/galactoside ABC-type transport system permease subunit
MIGEMRVSQLRNLINQVGTLSSYTQQMLSGAFLIVVVTAQIYLTRNRTL